MSRVTHGPTQVIRATTPRACSGMGEPPSGPKPASRPTHTSAKPELDAALAPGESAVEENDAAQNAEAGLGPDASRTVCGDLTQGECDATEGCLSFGERCTARCSTNDGCGDGALCDFVQHGECGVDAVCVAGEDLVVACQEVEALCGGPARTLCIEQHHDECGECDLCDDTPRLFCAFSPDGSMYVVQSNEFDVLRIDPGWTASGSFFATSTLTRAQTARCDQARPLPMPPLPCP